MTVASSPTPDNRPAVHVVMCTYNGARHLDAQWQSLLAQRWPVKILVCDDGSSDATRSLVAERLRPGLDQLCQGEGNLGHVGNFERGIQAALDAGAEWIACADQDDIWEPTRIEKGMQQLLAAHQQHDNATPLLAHSDLSLINDAGEPIAPSYLQWRGYDIAGRRDLPLILGQNGVMGNTLLINRALAELALPFPHGVPVHDYWLALAAELYGERRFLPEALVRYRLHDSNASDKQAVVRRRQNRLSHLVGGLGNLIRGDLKLPYREDSRDELIATLLKDDDERRRLDATQRKTLHDFLACLRGPGNRWHLFCELGRRRFLRQGLAERARLVLATAFTRRYRD